MLWLNLSLGQKSALKNELSNYADGSFSDLNPSDGFNTHEGMKEHIEKLHEAVDSIPDWRRNADEKKEWHASIDETMVKGVGFPTGEELPDMKASEYAEGED
jgi:hypothetical protein